MAIEIISGIRSYSREALDKRSGPYPDTASALANIPAEQRHVGLPVIVVANATYDASGNFTGGNVTRYIFDGGIGDGDLVVDSGAGGGSADGVLNGAVINGDGNLELSFTEGLPNIVVDMSGLGGTVNRTIATTPPTNPPSIPGEEYIVLSDTIYTT